ncbi:MAG: hypothetical protein J6T96_06885 [Bacteroidales bacterium]|jgi:hypothetical protein|nr:hypothetical protein [Bacteroidales bacterium]
MKSIIQEIIEYNDEYTARTGNKPPVTLLEAYKIILGCLMFPELAKQKFKEAGWTDEQLSLIKIQEDTL